MANTYRGKTLEEINKMPWPERKKWYKYLDLLIEQEAETGKFKHLNKPYH